MPKTFDPTKPCRTLDGRTARVICTDAPGPYPIVALVPSRRFPDKFGPMMFDTEGNAPPRYYGADGVTHSRFGMDVGNRPWDLENVPERQELLVPIALDSFGRIESFNSDRFYARPRIGHIRVTVEGARIVGAEILP
jgi:hypothetical protein